MGIGDPFLLTDTRADACATALQGEAENEPLRTLRQTGELTMTDSGRSALRLALRALQLPVGAHVMVSAYICTTLLSAVRAEMLHPVLYDVNADLSANEQPETLPDAAIMVGYFGTAPHIALANRLSQAGIPIIYDLTHSWLSEAVLDQVCRIATTGRQRQLIVASLRKMLPLPDGGMVWVPHGAALQIAQPEGCAPHADARLAAMAAGTQASPLSTGETCTYRPAFLAAEEALDSQQDIYALSDASRQLLKSLHLHQIIEQRRCNYAELLSDAARWRPRLYPLVAEMPPGFCPHGFVVVAESLAARDALHRHMVQHGIHPIVHWPLDAKVARRFAGARSLSMRLLTIPCDQRYGTSQMRLISRHITSWCAGRQSS